MTTLYTPPETDILVLGEMMRANKQIAKELVELPLSGADFDGSLEVIRARAEEIISRCGRLLKEPKGLIEARADLSQKLDRNGISGDIDDSLFAEVKANQDPSPEPKSTPAAPEKKRPNPFNGVPLNAAKEPAADTIKGRILALLKKKPMSSMELYTELKVEPTVIYTPCTDLKKSLLIESFIDENDPTGTRRYRLTK